MKVMTKRSKKTEKLTHREPGGKRDGWENMGGRSQKRRGSSHGVNFGKERGVSSLKGGREEGPVLAG